jgi:hypothetical protein
MSTQVRNDRGKENRGEDHGYAANDPDQSLHATARAAAEVFHFTSILFCGVVIDGALHLLTT